jgi:Vacuolar-sorting-associated 13 protein C-terminal
MNLVSRLLAHPLVCFWFSGKASQNLPSLIATLFPNVSDAPVRLPGKSVKHTFENAADIIGSIQKFYTSETLKQFYKIVGALDFVGNPTMLVTSVFSGVRDFFVTPSTALINSPGNPSRFGIGFAKVNFYVALILSSGSINPQQVY